MLTLLTKKGYIVRKKDLNEKQQEALKTKLTAIPKEYEDFKKKDDPSFRVFSEDDDNFYIPRFFGEKEYGKPKVDELYRGRKINITFKGELRDYQLPIADLVQKQFDTVGGGIVSLPCGRGKTILAINAIVRRQVQTLVIVHKDFLMKQWKRQIERFTDAKVGIIQRGKVQVEGCDIVLGMLKSISIKEYKENTFSQFGLVVVDECHHIAAKVYSRSLPKITSRYTLGLSATPKRQDGLTKVFHWYMGPMIYREDLRENKCVIAKVYNFKTEHKLFRTFVNWMGRPIKEKMVSNMTIIPERTQLIVDLINNRRSRSEYAKILILSRRREHLTLIKEMIDADIKKDKDTLRTLNRIVNILESDKPVKIKKIDTSTLYALIEKYERRSSHKTGYYVGGMKEKQLAESETKDVIFGTYDMAEEGLDIPCLNTIVLATPKPNVVQSVGRILRLENYEISPEIIDICDQISMFNGFGKSREKYYNKSKYKIVHYSALHMNDETVITKIVGENIIENQVDGDDLLGMLSD